MDNINIFGDKFGEFEVLHVIRLMPTVLNWILKHYTTSHTISHFQFAHFIAPPISLFPSSLLHPFSLSLSLSPLPSPQGEEPPAGYKVLKSLDLGKGLMGPSLFLCYCTNLVHPSSVPYTPELLTRWGVRERGKEGGREREREWEGGRGTRCICASESDKYWGHFLLCCLCT